MIKHASNIFSVFLKYILQLFYFRFDLEFGVWSSQHRKPYNTDKLPVFQGSFSLSVLFMLILYGHPEF